MILFLIIWNVLLTIGVVYLLFTKLRTNGTVAWVPSCYIDREGIWFGRRVEVRVSP